MGNLSSITSDCVTSITSCYQECYQGCYQGYLDHCTTISIEVQQQQIKDKYQNYTDELSISPKAVNLELAYHTCTDENTPVYTYENIKKLVKVLRIIDGDTIDIALYYDDNGKVFKHRVRLYGIDTPESHPLLSNPERNKEIEAAKKSKEALQLRLQENDNLVVALFHKFDKYGRLMATLYDKQGEDINKWMIESGYAQEYFGKTKKKFEEPKTLMVSECDLDYFETPRKNEPSEPTSKTPSVKEENNEPEEEFEELSEEVQEEIKNEIRIV